MISLYLYKVVFLKYVFEEQSCIVFGLFVLLHGTPQEKFQPVRLNGGWLPRQRRAQNLWSIVGSVGRS